MPGRHRRRRDDRRLGVLLGQGPEHQGRAVPRQAPVHQRPRPVRRQLRRVQLLRLRRRRPDLQGEYRAWRVTGSSFVAAKAGGLDLESPLGYSDGTKYSRASETPSVPNWRSSAYGLPNPPYPFPATYQNARFGDAAWRDSERDADRDGLSNWLESARGPSNNDWWKRYWGSDANFAPAIEPWAKKAYCTGDGQYRQRPGYFNERPFADLDLADSDVDGDSLLDGEDDQDNDDYTNILELYNLEGDPDGNGAPTWCGYAPGNGLNYVPTIDLYGVPAAVNPFNPCAPNTSSRSCQDYIPF